MIATFNPYFTQERQHLTNVVYMIMDSLKRNGFTGWHMCYWGRDYICLDSYEYHGLFIPKDEYDHVAGLCEYPDFKCEVVPWEDDTIVIKISIKSNDHV